MRKAYFFVLIFCVVLFCTSCFEYSEEITINNDGSGRLELKIGLSSMLAGMMAMGDATESPFKQMEDAATKINEEGDPKGLISHAEFSEADESDMKRYSFAIDVTDMTRIAEAVDSEWWRGAPGVDDTGEKMDPPFKLERHGDTFIFTKEIVVPAEDGTVPGREEHKAEGATGNDEGHGFEFEPERLTPEGDGSHENDSIEGDTSNGTETGAMGLMDKAIGIVFPASPAIADEKDVKIETHAPKADEPEEWQEFYAEGIDLAQDIPETPEMPEMPDMPEIDEEQMAQMAMQMFAGKFYKVRLTVPELVQTNGNVLSEPTEGEEAQSGPVTIEWVVPMSDMMTGNGYYRLLSAEFTLGKHAAGGGIIRGFDIRMLIVAAAGLIVLLFVGLLAISMKARKPAKEKETAVE